ncbi:glycosyltransferase family 1 protein [Sphaerospermopsis aphanizomenoides BCCUSP55]|uniref:glycosyltransferase family 1 protein n=1 Tax=Sphaerospermopsis aphanizomenoides TaxID=459663 RepID=UPI000B058E2F|nr:glycosyltransferase family 1 protein [Sphaerospermopsis aphanizomenoides]MBK1987842.1 glycosyltransferase family 1 protein [Sphaerospermopsis aphanizomenoides BCCUSP55]
MVITVVVPRLPPAVDGVGDYGINLAKQMRQNFNVMTEFVIGDANWTGDDIVEGFPVKQVSTPSKTALLALLPHEQNSEQIVLLHYVGYGYARRGCPIWLVEGLEKWRKGANNRRLVTMFHEIYAFGAIWTSQFWTSPLQRNLAARLVRLSDRCITSKQGYADIIGKFSQGKHSDIPTLPVFSNVGEPESLTPLSARPRRLVIFGGTGPRSRVYQTSQLALKRTCQELEIEEIFDIGPALKFEITPLNNIPVTCLGINSASEISDILSSSLVGFFNYPLAFLTKSGIFAAYCAHKVLPVGTWDEGRDLDGLVAGKHYWLGDRYEQKMNLADGQIVADHAYNWYEQHNLSAQARIFTNFTSFHLITNRRGAEDAEE